MAKIINISDKLSSEKPNIQVGDKVYPVNDSLETVMKFEEMYESGSDSQSMLECLKLALGSKAYTELKFEKSSFKNIQVWFLAVMACMQDMEYSEVEARFRNFNAKD